MLFVEAWKLSVLALGIISDSSLQVLKFYEIPGPAFLRSIHRFSKMFRSGDEGRGKTSIVGICRCFGKTPR